MIPQTFRPIICNDLTIDAYLRKIKSIGWKVGWRIIYSVYKRLEVTGLAHKGNDGATKKTVMKIMYLLYYPKDIGETIMKA